MTWTAEFLDKPLWLWAIFVTVVVGLLAFDLGVLHRKSREIPLKESLVLSGAYILVAVVFGAWTWATLGSDAARPSSAATCWRRAFRSTMSSSSQPSSGY